MLERLADLIRDRVFWKPRIDTETRPAGSVEGGGFTVVPDMMSLVGCSGEEFKAILRSLGFRMQIKKTPSPALSAPVVPAADPVASAQDETAPSVGDADLPPTAIAVLDEPVEASPEPLPETEATPAPEVPPAEIELEVWWPKDTGPFRHRAQAHPKPSHRPQKPEGSGERQRPSRPARGKHQKPAGKPSDKRPDAAVSRRPEKPMDPDSPFAVLGALKAQLAGSKN